MHAPFVPAGHNLSPHLGGNFWFLPCLFKIKTTFRLQPRLAVKCFVFISQCTASKGLSYKCFPSPAMSLLSQGYGGGMRDRAVHALFPLESHLNNHGEGKQRHSANSCTCDVFIFCSEICMACTADSGACGSPLRHWHLKLSVWEQGFKCEEIPQLKIRCCKCQILAGRLASQCSPLAASVRSTACLSSSGTHQSLVM